MIKHCIICDKDVIPKVVNNVLQLEVCPICRYYI